MYLIVSRKGQISFKNDMIFLAKIYIHVLGGGRNTIGTKNRSAEMGWGWGVGGIAGT
jgi:hypothetical protein